MNHFRDSLVTCTMWHTFLPPYVQIALIDVDGNYTCALVENMELYFVSQFRKQTYFMDMACGELSSHIFQAVFFAYQVIKGKRERERGRFGFYNCS